MGRGNLVGYSPWGLKESDTTEQINNDNSSGSAFIILEEGQGLQSVQTQLGSLSSHRREMLVACTRLKHPKGGWVDKVPTAGPRGLLCV